MKSLPYVTEYVNTAFEREKSNWDYVFLRPVLIFFYFFLRVFIFPFKFFFHRRPYGFEARCIDGLLAFGMKYFATNEAVEMMVRHVQIEPLLYRHILSTQSGNHTPPSPLRKFNGIDGDFNMDDLREMVINNLTIGHDELSYEMLERFDKNDFLENLDELRRKIPEDHGLFRKGILEATQTSSRQWIG
ncbi:DUF6999 family protein [Luteolibacter algae]|uniref:DUF6999 family protein n=1 Tax=Luteolibacter algae TaxID=454151 RepID=A0ABW5DAW2_9BACT